jgi:outer membrane protein assembly factor BamA
LYRNKAIIYITLLLFLFAMDSAAAVKKINEIFIDRREVFDSNRVEWFFAAPFANSMHWVTQQYLIEDELLFKEEDELNYDLVYETVRNLRSTGLFADVSFQIDSINPYNSDVSITTRDRWSTRPSILFGTGGKQTRYGLRLEELNLAGTGTHLSIEGLHNTENNIGWQGIMILRQRRLFRSEYSADASFLAHKYRTEQSLTVQKPFRTLATSMSYGASYYHNWGNDFLYISEDNYEKMPFEDRTAKLWLSSAWQEDSRVFATALLEYEQVNRGKPEFRRAYDNSGKFFLAFSSITERYEQTNMLNSYATEDLQIGGWGSAILGKVFPIRSNGENFYYVAGLGERSFYKNNFYLFLSASGASAFSRSYGYYTYQDFMGLAFYRFSDKFVLSSRIKQQTVWNWNTLRQLILDNDNGLRGYAANNLTGDNRIVSNTELRMFPNWPMWIFNFSGVLFYDCGSVWNQDVKLGKTRWHNSVGFGLRIHNGKESGSSSIFRFDFAFNLDEKKFTEIIFTTDQLFSVFKKHEFKLPTLSGLEFNN